MTTNYGHNLASYKSENLSSDYRPFVKLHRKFVFLPQLMSICHHRVTKHSLLMIEALVTGTCCQWQAGWNQSIKQQLCRNHTHFLQISMANTWLHACIQPWCNLPLLSSQKNLDSNWIRTVHVFHHVNATIRTTINPRCLLTWFFWGGGGNSKTKWSWMW